jgi:putative membrane protein
MLRRLRRWAWRFNRAKKRAYVEIDQNCAVVRKLGYHRCKLATGGALGRAVPPNDMIKNFGDHSANERTFLAWVRTAIAVMAFGFLVEKFDLFLEVAAPSLAGRTLSLPDQQFGNIGGLALIILGTAMIAIAAIRFLITAKTIDSDELHPSP